MSADGLTCSYCGNKLEGEEIENPKKNPDYNDEPICDYCHEEHFEFECCRCLGYELNEHQHDYLVVYEQIDDVEPGIYRINNFPYHGGDMLGGAWLYADSLQRIRDLEEPTGVNRNNPCGHLCRNCRDALKLNVESKEVSNG